MHRLTAVMVGVGTSLVLGACGLGWAGSGSIHPGCLQHAQPVDCTAALEAVMDEVDLDLDRYSVSVGTIECEDGRCTTWVNGGPIDADDCMPLYEIEVTRPLVGSWSVGMQTHGDPPCAFEP